jgi:hypothetical protein
MPDLWLPLVLVGLVAGIAAGMFGIGGGVIIVPALSVVLGLALKNAIGTSLAALLMPVSIFAVLTYYRAGKLRVATAAWIAAGLVGGAIAGAQIALALDTTLLERLYGVFLLYMAWRFIEPRRWWAEWRGTRSAQPTPEVLANPPWVQLFILGLIAGVLAGMFGIGGGVIIVSALVQFLHFDQKQAVGTSLAALLPPVSLGAVISYYNEGMLDIAAAALVAAGLVLGSIAGARIALGMSSGTIKRMYGFLLVFVGLRYLLGA